MTTRSRIRRACVIAVSSAAFGVAGVAAAAAPASAAAAGSAGGAPAVTPLFTCPDRSVCFFPKDDYTGNPTLTVATQGNGGVWAKFDSLGVPNPGSMNDNSGSVVWLYDKSGGMLTCVDPGRHVLDKKYGYFDIDYGIGDCSSPNAGHPPLP